MTELLVRQDGRFRFRRNGLPFTETTAPPPVVPTGMVATRTAVHGPNSVWNLPIAARGSAAQVIDTSVSSINGQPHAFNLAQQVRYNNATPTDGVLGYFGPNFGVSMNLDNYSMPVYVVPENQPTREVWWNNWQTDPWTHVGRGVNGDLEGQFLATPLPDINLCNPGTNGLYFSRAAAAGATTIWAKKQTYGTCSYGGGEFTITAAVRETTGEWRLTISPGLAASAVVNSRALRPRQMESNGSDCSLIVLRPSAAGPIELFEFWGFKPDSLAPGGYSFANAGYVADTRTWNGVYPFTWGMRAVSMSAIGGAITMDDLARGSINHALNIAIPVSGTVSGTSFDAPATRWDGALHTLVAGVSDGGDPGRHRLRVGGYFRLPEAGWSNAQITSFVIANKVFSTDQAVAEMCLRAIRDYGIYITDTSGAVSFYGEGEQSIGTPYNPYTRAEYDAIGSRWYDWYLMPFWTSLVKLAPVSA